jgi:arylsulfatase A
MIFLKFTFHFLRKNGLVLLFVSLLTSCTSGPDERPNILYIIADDLGYEKVGCYNDLVSFTPNIDRLAEQGVMFTRAYASPVCTPSRMSIYTGTYATTHQYTDVLPVHLGTKEFIDFENEWTSYAQLLREEGYHTAVTGKWQLAALEFHPEHIRSAGFDSWCVWQIWHKDKKTTRYWNATLNEDGSIRTDINDRFGSDVLTEYVIRQMETAVKIDTAFCIQHNMMLPHVPIVRTPDDTLNNREAGLDYMIGYLDKQVGILVDAIQKLDIQDKTVIIFLGDNGTQSRGPRETEKGLVHGGKWTLTDGGMHVPLIFSGPGILASGIEDENLIDITDIFPTICELTGTKIPEDIPMDGVSFYPNLKGKDEKQRDWITAGFLDDYIVFDGAWRLQYSTDELIDCRDLPEEKPADMQSDEAKEAHAYLKSILGELL